MMQQQQQQDVTQSESDEVKPTISSGGGGSLFSLASNSSPSTPTAWSRFIRGRTGRDSGYGTDYSPSPSSNTSSRHFVFNDDMITGKNVSPSKDVQDLSLSKRLENIQVMPRNNLDIENDTVDVFEQKSDEFEEDEHDNEVKNINANNNFCCQIGLLEEDEVERPSAPLPCLENSATNGEPYLEVGDGSSNSTVVRPSLLRIEEKGSSVLKIESSQMRTVHVTGPPPVEYLSRDRSHSMPNVRAFPEQEVGRQLRRLSDDFFNLHLNRRRRRTLSVESSAIPVRVNIEMYAGRTPTDERSNSDSDDNEEGINRNSEE